MASKTGGLGRGLAALIRDNTTTGVSIENPQRASVDRIRSASWQPRRTFRAESLAELAESIRSQGILQPLLVRTVSDGYELIAGERRLRAAIEAGLTEVPIRVVDVDDRGAMELALIENLQREDLNPIEEAEGYRQLIERHGLTQEDVARRVGRARATVANALRLLSLPAPVLEWIKEGTLSTGHAKALLSLPLAEEQIALARRIVREGLSVRETERLAARTVSPRRSRRSASSNIPEAHLRDMTERLQRKFGTAVRLTPPRIQANGRRAPGELIIEFYTPDDLDRLMVILGLSDEGL